MNSNRKSTGGGWSSTRTRVITIVSIVAVGIAGATAVSANIGILDSASDGKVGSTSATGDLGVPSPNGVDPTATVAARDAKRLPNTDPNVQRFQVDAAGIVGVTTNTTGLHLDSVEPSPGWHWTLRQSDTKSLTVTLVNGARNVEFEATTTGDGRLSAKVAEPVAAPNKDGRDGRDDDKGKDHDKDHDRHDGGDDDD